MSTVTVNLTAVKIVRSLRVEEMAKWKFHSTERDIPANIVDRLTFV